MQNLATDIKNFKIKGNQTGLWYIGQVGFIIKSQNYCIAIDPYLSDYVDKNCCSENVLWKRLYPAPFGGEQLDFLDAVICTHSHYDHADPWTLTKIAQANPNTMFIVPAPVVKDIIGYGINPKNVVPAHVDESILIGDFNILPIPSAHEEFHQDENGDYYELGYLIENEDTKIFHAGDMCPYDGLEQKIADISVAILPVNGRDDQRRANDIIGNFNCEEALTLANNVNAKLFIPVHHDLYAINGVSSDEIKLKAQKTAPNLNYKILEVGENVVL